MGRGGARPGAGRKKTEKRLDKERAAAERQQARWTKDAAREHVMQRVCAELDPLLDAQLAHAKGLKYLVTRDKKTGKFIRVGPAMAGAVNEETVEVWEKDPSTPAFTDLLNRALDKPKEQEQELHLTGDVTLLDKIARARARLQKKP
jgi:hypothetical protein